MEDDEEIEQTEPIKIEHEQGSHRINHINNINRLFESSRESIISTTSQATINGHMSLHHLKRTPYTIHHIRLPNGRQTVPRSTTREAGFHKGTKNFSKLREL